MKELPQAIERERLGRVALDSRMAQDHSLFLSVSREQ